MCVYMHTHTHIAHMGYSVVSPGVGMRHLEGPKNPDGLNLDMCLFVYVHKVHRCMCVSEGGMRSWTNFSFDIFFQPKKKNKRCEHKTTNNLKSQIDLSQVRYALIS